MDSVKTQVIGVAGSGPRAGKDTFGSMLQIHSGHKPIAFADPLKDMVSSLLAHLGYQPHQITEMVRGSSKEEPIEFLGGGKFTPRFLMQTLGTEWGRNTVDTHFWTEVMNRRIQRFKFWKQPVVITDVRFQEELSLVRSHGGLMVFIDRPDVDDIPHPSEGKIRAHHCDVEVPNVASYSEFERNCRVALSTIRHIEHALNTMKEEAGGDYEP